MNKEILGKKQQHQRSKVKNYSTIITMDILLTIFGGCNFSSTKKNDKITTKTEIIDNNKTHKLAENYENIAYKARTKQEQTVAIPNYIKALEYYQELGNKKKEQIISKNIALGYYQQENYSKYLEYIQKALKLAEEINYEYGIRFANASLGGYRYTIKNQPEIALQKYYLPGRESLKSLSNEDDKKELQAIYASAIGNCYMLMKNYDEAKKYRKHSMELNKDIKNNQSTNISINYNMGITEEVNKNYEKAEKHYLEGLKISKEENIKYNIQLGYDYLANLYETRGDHKKAYEYRTEQYNISQEINNETSARTQIELETSIKDKQLIQQKAEITQQQERQKVLEEQKKKTIRTAIASLFATLGAGSAAVIAIKGRKKEKKHKEEIAHQNKQLEHLNQELVGKNNDITESMEAGKSVQEKIVLSSPEYIKKLFPESFVLFKPQNEIISGDFYRFEETKSGKKLFAAVDCTGHGIPGAFVSFIGSEILNEAVNNGLEEPNDILSFLDEKIIEIQSDQKDTNTFAKYGMDIALCSRDETTRTLQYSGAVNPIYIINYTPQETKTREISPNKSKIGYRFQGQKNEYKIDSITIDDPNTIIYLSSDGYQDQFGGEKGKKLKRSEFKKYLESATKEYFAKGHTDMSTIQAFLEEKFKKRKGDREQIDDVMIIGIKV